MKKNTDLNTLFRFVRILFVSMACSMVLIGCIHPKVGIRKAYLLDPTMDPAQPGQFSDTMSGTVHGGFEKAVVSGGGASGGSCPTCK